MRPVARWIALLTMAGTANFAAADENHTDAAPSKAANESNAALLADRHLAFYRAVRLPATTTESISEGDDSPAPVVRTSAIAAIPLPPPSPEADGQ